MKTPQLECNPAIGTKQFAFEELCTKQFGFNYGFMAVNITDNRYCNMNVQFMWQMFATKGE